MPEIIPTIYKDKLDKASSYLLKYSDIERCFSGRSSSDLYLDVHFNRHQRMWKEDRDRQQAAGHSPSFTVTTFHTHRLFSSMNHEPIRRFRM